MRYCNIGRKLYLSVKRRLFKPRFEFIFTIEEIRFRFNSAESIERSSFARFNFLLEKRKLSFIAVMIKIKFSVSAKFVSTMQVLTVHSLTG